MAQPYVIGAIIAAIPATFTSIAAWHGIHKGRKENTDDHAKVVDELSKLGIRMERLDTRIESVDIKVEKTDLRFDVIEDKIERHLGWHRTQAELDLEQSLKKDVPDGFNPNNHRISTSSTDD